MAPLVPTATLDPILALQLAVAWAGEGKCEPRRLGWWQTDLIDPLGGGDLFARLTPRTAPWAGLQAAREAARRADAHARRQMSDPDRLRTLFFLGFEIDERLDDRLLQLKREGSPPEKVLPLAVELGASFNRQSFAEALRHPGAGEGAYTVVPGGRQLKGAPPASLELTVRHLAAALLPLAEHYPLPFYRLAL